MEANLTDDALRSIGTPLGRLLLERSIIPRAIKQGTSTDDQNVDFPILDDGASEPDAADSNILDAEVAIAATIKKGESDEQVTDRERMHEIFKHDNGHFQLDNAHLKGSSKQDTGRRLVYLLLYAYLLEGRDRVNRNEIDAVLEDAGLHDKNSYKHFENRTELYIEGDLIGLRLSGRSKAKGYLDQVLDPNVAQDWFLGSTARRRGRAVSRTDTKAEGKAPSSKARRSGQSKQVEEWYRAWKELDLRADVHNKFKSRSLADKGLAGLWAIRRAIGDSGKEISSYLATRFILEAFELQLDARNLTRALKKDKNHVINTAGSMFQINQTGIQYVEELLNVADASNIESSAEPM